MASKYFNPKFPPLDTRKRNQPKDPKEIAAADVKLRKKDKVSPESSATPLNESIIQSKGSTSKLDGAFFDVPCATLAKNLLGQLMVRSIGTQKIKGRIVETEAYIGPVDKAAHSYKGKRTPRNEAMFMAPGTSYVYNIYGMYCCMNISSQGDGAAVLIRALEPVEGQDLMHQGRGNKASKNKKPLKEKDLANGPSKLCQAFHISKRDFDQVDLTSCDSLWLESGDNVADNEIIHCPRINIGYADDWIDKPLRFYILGNSSVSVKDKTVEKEYDEV